MILAAFLSYKLMWLLGAALVAIFLAIWTEGK